MASAASAAGFADLVLGIMALEIFFFLDPQSGTGGTAPSAQAPLLDSALKLLLPLMGVAGVFAAVAYIYHHLSRRHAAANMSIPGPVVFILSVSVGVLQYLFFVQPAAGGGAVEHAARARAVGLGALRALPTAATAAFYWGMMLIIIAHVRVGGEGGGGGAIQVAARILTKIGVGMASGLVFLVTAAFCIKY